MHIMFWGFLTVSCMGEETVRVKLHFKNQMSMNCVHTLILITHYYRLHDLWVEARNPLTQILKPL